MKQKLTDFCIANIWCKWWINLWGLLPVQMVVQKITLKEPKIFQNMTSLINKELFAIKGSTLYTHNCLQ